MGNTKSKPFKADKTDEMFDQWHLMIRGTVVGGTLIVATNSILKFM
jgi:hypothetical protein